MNEEPSFADEVVVVLIDGEVVDGFLVCNRGDGNDSAPVPLQRLYKVADLHCGGVRAVTGWYLSLPCVDTGLVSY